MIITLLSDFGYQDNFVGVAKGLLLNQLPDARIIDLSHEVMPFHLLQCSYFLRSSYRYFPEGTIHISLFDLLYQRPAALLIAPIDRQYMLSADNHLLPLTFPELAEEAYDAGIQAASHLDWIRQTAAFLKEWQQKQFSLSALQKTKPLAGSRRLQPFVGENSLECQVIHIDKYGNVIINISQDDFERFRAGRPFQIDFSRNESIREISHDYSDVAEGDKLCRFNSGGFLELAVNKGSAARLFGLSVRHEQQLIYQKIIIRFL